MKLDLGEKVALWWDLRNSLRDNLRDNLKDNLENSRLAALGGDLMTTLEDSLWGSLGFSPWADLRGGPTDSPGADDETRPR